VLNIRDNEHNVGGSVGDRRAGKSQDAGGASRAVTVTLFFTTHELVLTPTSRSRSLPHLNTLHKAQNQMTEKAHGPV
jgi:hypothetical protein